MECTELNWLCEHMKKVKSSQASISINPYCTELYRGPFETFSEVFLFFYSLMALIFFLTVAESYNERSDSYNYRRQL